jgi:hypothetical protein
MASWIDSEINGDDHELTPERSSRHWVRCLEQAADADICLFYAPEGATQCGSLIEIGAALVSGREVWVVSDYQWTIAHHPRCRTFKSIEACVAAVVARVKGERARLEALARMAHEAAQLRGERILSGILTER